MLLRRFFLGMGLFLVALVLAVIVLGRPMVGYVVKSSLSGAGFENPEVRVAALTPNHVRLENISANANGAEALEFQFIEADFQLVDLLRRRTVNNLNIGEGRIRLAMSRDGRVSIPGLDLGSDGGGGLPFNALSIADVDFTLATPMGEASGFVSGNFDADAGGAGALTLETVRAGTDALQIENAKLSLGAILDEQGIAQINGDITGDFVTDAIAARNSVAAISVEGLTRDLKFDRAEIVISAANLPIDEISNAASIRRAAELGLGENASSFAFSGSINAAYQEEVWSFYPAEDGQAIRLEADTGALFEISARGADPILSKRGADHSAAFDVALSSEKANATGALSIEKNEEAWRLSGPISIGALEARRLKFQNAAVDLTVFPEGNSINVEAHVQSVLALAKIGRLNVFDAPIDANFRAVVDRENQRAVVYQATQCVLLDDVRVTIDRQDTELLLSGANFCADGNPVAEISWLDEMVSEIRGRLTAERAHYRLGATNLVGAPPEIDAVAVYRPALNKTIIDGEVDGGAMALNDLLNLSSTKGNFTFALEKEVMRVDLRFDQTRVSQRRDPALVAPALASGNLSLLGQEVEFDYVVTTLGGARIGAGVGEHNVTTAKGKSRLTFDELKFAQGGMQPAQLLPVLRGFARDATGAARGFADFWWDRGEGISSSAEFELVDVTFTGPTRIVNQTRALNGFIRFADLWPLRTDGLQTVTVEGADLDALQLAAGEIVFEMTGDETLRVESASFPWFGGSLGVDGAVMAYSGGEAVAPLRANNVDLKQLFDSIDIDGLSGEGILSGVLPLVVEDGRARIENGVLASDTPGAIRYQGQAAEAAAASGGQAKTAFDLLRDLRYESLEARIEGPLDGRLQFQISIQGTGEVDFHRESVRVPVKYNINLDAALLELLQQAQLSRRIELQIDRGISGLE